MLLDESAAPVQTTDAILGFATEDDDTWEVWDRYLTTEGKKAYHLGNICGAWILSKNKVK